MGVGFSNRKPIWKSTFTIGIDGELYCNLDYYVLDYSYSDFVGIDINTLRI